MGNREMHPVLVSIANITAGVRMKATSHAFAILAYLPIPKFLDVSPAVQTTLANRVYHACFDIFLANLKRAEAEGHFMSDPNGRVRLCFTPLVSHVLDMAEQRQVALVLTNQSPTSTASYNQFGDATQQPPRTRDYILNQITNVCLQVSPNDVAAYTREAARVGILGVHLPYWRDYGSACPSLFMTTDVLHAMHKFFFDHVITWVVNMIGGPELDRRLQALPISLGIRHWSNGVSRLKQCTGREHRDLEKIIVPVIAGAVEAPVLCAIRAIVEFIFTAQALLLYRDHFHALREALREFHTYKNDIIRAGGHRGKNGPILHFKIPKLEGFGRVAYNADHMGAPYQYTSDITERCHMTHVKQPFRRSNRRNFVEQCARYLDRLEKVSKFDLYTRLRSSGASLLNLMVEEASEVADHYPEATWLSHVLPKDEYQVRGAASCLSLSSKTRSRLSDDLSMAFLLTLKPHYPSLYIADASAQFKIPDLRGALGDYFDNTTVHPQSRQRLHLETCSLDFSYLHVWKNLRIQQRSSQDEHILLPVRTLQALPPSSAMPFGRCNTVLINDDISGSPMKDSDGQRYSVAQLRMIFTPVLSDKRQQTEALCYVDIFEFSPDLEHRDENDPEVAITAPDIDMFVINRSYHDDGRRVGDIISIKDIREVVELVPIFGRKIATHINCDNSLEEDSFYLNHFANKESFHSILSYQ
ncbi:hypothetical protein HWV62_13026 [Athelia sp. TMB]|nr:hypothetical protein HWV62_13026 [Athelia sp. TMB]